MQSRGNGVKRGTKSQFPESTKTIKGHDLYLGSLLFLTKTAPSPRFRTNLFLNYNIETGRIIIPDDISRTIKKLDMLLQGKITNTNINLLDENGYVNALELGELDDESEETDTESTSQRKTKDSDDSSDD